MGRYREQTTPIFRDQDRVGFIASVNAFGFEEGYLFSGIIIGN